MELRQKIAYLEAALHKKSRECETARQDVFQLKELYESRQAAMTEKIASLEANASALQQELANASRTTDHVRRIERQAARERVQVMGEIAGSRVTTLEQKIKALQEANRVLEEDRLQFLRDTARDVGKLNLCIESAREQIIQLQGANKRLRQSFAVAAAERDTLREENEILSREIGGLRERNENLMRELIRADRILYGKPRPKK